MTNDGTITQDFCTARNSSDFLRLGGLEGMGKAYPGAWFSSFPSGIAPGIL